MYDFNQYIRHTNIDDVTLLLSVCHSLQHENEMIQLSQILISELSVPLVSINNQTAILPLVGTLDHDRSKILQERV